MAEVPWFSTPPEATLAWIEGSDLGHLHFIDPNGQKAAVAVTRGPTRADPFNVWHIEISGDVATISPSVHYIGRWHTLLTPLPSGW